jgi:glutamate/tyrosine decarboxylase-like PLP-dependent enzyme
MRSDALASAIDADRRDGLTPVFVCATAGTTNTGAIDPTPDIAPIARERGVWLHVDGAYGAPAALGAHGAPLREGFALADSLAVDPHKWLFTPIDIGCVLFRDEHAQFDAFTTTSDYVEVHQTAPIERFAFFDRGFELSRRFRALKLWLLLRLRGAGAIAREIDRHIALRERLDRRIAEAPNLERIAGGLSIICFRVRPPGASDDEADAATTRALERINDTGRFLLSPTKVNGRPALRVCIVGFRTREQDIDELASIAAAEA